MNIILSVGPQFVPKENKGRFIAAGESVHAGCNRSRLGVIWHASAIRRFRDDAALGPNPYTYVGAQRFVSDANYNQPKTELKTELNTELKTELKPDGITESAATV